MVGTNMKSETMNLMDKRTSIESEMNGIIDRLCRPGGPGLSGNLLDSEGFPRTDIDIPVLVSERRRLSELRNDYKEITDKIDANIQVLHSLRLTPRSKPVKESGVDEGLNNAASASASMEYSVSVDTNITVGVPFAMVDDIAHASPAAEDGLQLGDQIVKFGNVEAGDDLVQRLASESQKNQGNEVPVVLMRQGAIVNVNVKPRAWQGRGLLGCHFQML